MHSVLILLFGLFGPVSLLYAQTFTDASDQLPENVEVTRGPGMAAVDVNADGLTDLYQYGQLFLNRGAAGFVNVHDEAGLAEGGEAVFGGLFGDYDDDGFLDLYMEDLLPPSFLYRNRGDGTFVQRTAEAGLQTDVVLAQGSVWGDFNTDDRLDLFIGSDDGLNLLYENRDYSTFIDRSATANIQFPPHSYGVAASDYDRDGDLDLFIASCHPSDPALSLKIMLRNEGGMQFADATADVRILDDLASWGVVWLDYDNDGWQDLYVTNMPAGGRSGTNRLYKNFPQIGLLNVSTSAGVRGEASEASFGVAAADFDNDGWIDLYVANVQVPDRLYRNNGDGTFTDVMDATGIGETNDIGVATGDFDGDGWMDLALTSSGRNRLLLNNGGTNHWLKVQARGTASNHFGVGSKVEVYHDGTLQLREIVAGDGMSSQNHDLTAHFGLGTRTVVDSVVVRWPSGQIDRLDGVTADQTITVVEGVGVNAPPSTFHLATPVAGHVSTSTDATIAFAWDVPTDADALTYTFRVTGPGVRIEMPDLSEPSFTLDASALPLDETYYWTVSATDGHSVRSSLDRFALERTTSTASEQPVSVEALRIAAYPNPFREALTIRLEHPDAAIATITIFDGLGRRIRMFDDAERTGLLHWDGRDEQGARVPAGVYFVRVETARATRTKSLVYLR